MAWSRDDIQRLVEVEAQLAGVDPRLALAVAQQESNFDPAARSRKGAAGVFQLMPGTARSLAVNPADVADNIRGGITYLKQQLDTHGGDPRLALAAYNAGPGAVERWQGVPPFKETRGYVSRILGMLSPASAEAATPQALGRSRLDEIEAELARREAQTPAGGTQAPGGPPTPSAAPAPSPADEQYAAQTIAQMRQRQTPREPVTDPAALLAGGAAQGGAPPPVTDPAALLAVGGGQAPVPQSREQQLLAQAQERQRQQGTPPVPLPPGVPSVEQETLQEGFTRPSTMIPLLMPGAGVKAVTRC